MRLVVFALLAVGLLAAVPLWAKTYDLYLLSLAATNVIAAVGLALLTGFTGQLSIGNAGFLAIGAYGAALLVRHLGVEFWVAIPSQGSSAAWRACSSWFPPFA